MRPEGVLDLPGPARPAPRLGEHTDEVLAALGPAPAAPGGGAASPPPPGPVSAPASAPAPGGPPLAGLRVLDFGWVWSGPMAAMILAELGAEVVKIESRTRMEPNRLRSGDLGDEDPGFVSFSIFR
ncbi:MAG: CoA transferase, partial [Clostridia bacterium]|nr:CoA transferase [Clostridia bacterium]